MVEDMFNIGFFTTKMAAIRPSWKWSRNKMKCLCKRSFVICLPSLNKIGKCMSEKWLRTCSTSDFLQLKWPPVGHLGSNHETKSRSYVYHRVLSLCQVWTKSVQTYPRYGCRRTDARTDETQSINPCFRQSPMGANNTIGPCHCQNVDFIRGHLHRFYWRGVGDNFSKKNMKQTESYREEG